MKLIYATIIALALVCGTMQPAPAAPGHGYSRGHGHKHYHKPTYRRWHMQRWHHRHYSPRRWYFLWVW